MKVSKAYIFANGDLKDPLGVRSHIQEGNFYVAVDGGLKHLISLHIKPDLAIGDFDSLTLEQMEYLENHQIPKLQLQTRKNETDLEIAIQTAFQMGYKEIVLLGVLGGRLDHTLENLFILTKPEWKKVKFIILDGDQKIYVIRNFKEVNASIDDIFSLIPLSNKVTQVSTEGLFYPLKKEDLFRKNARGISNLAVSEVVSIRIKSGILLCFHIYKEKIRGRNE